jgi:hypothetical protein
MMKCRGFLVLVLAVALLGSPGDRASAWEFNLSGSFQALWEYYSQQGSQGFFGKYNTNVDTVSSASVAARNGWLGIDALTSASPYSLKHPGVVTGADASRASIKMELYPEFKLTPALRIQGKYRIGGTNRAHLYTTLSGIPQTNSEYVSSMMPGTDNYIAFGEWTTLWATAVTPVGTVIVGKRPWAIGCGLAYHGAERTDESVLLVVPYGPLQFGIGVYPFTLGYGDRYFDIERRGVFGGYYFGDGLSYLTAFAYYPNQVWDRRANPDQFMAFVSYGAGSLSAGFGAKYGSIHLGPEGIPYYRNTNGHSGLSAVPTLDQNDLEGWSFAKFNNGRFFFNAEVDFFKRTRRFQRSADGSFFGIPDFHLGAGSGSFFAPQYIDMWQGMIETGVFAGPTKLTFFYAYLPGPDRRHGILLDRQPTTYPYVPEFWYPQNVNQHVPSAAVFRQYSLILGYDYGAGLNCMDVNGNGTMTDASVLAARVDYAVAANLNLFGSFLYANRLSHAWQWGFIYPDGEILNFKNFRYNNDPELEFSDPVPTIPDTSLGWEVTAGGQWKLLEGWMVSATAAYWMPGRWFNYACVDRSVPNWYLDPSPANNWGINPNRKIDPIFGLEVRASLDF